MMTRVFPFVLLLIGVCGTGAAQTPRPADLRRTALTSSGPSGEIVRWDIDGDGKTDVVERWWNGKRVRWLDENGDLVQTTHAATRWPTCCRWT